LGSLSGSAPTFAYGINNSGQVVGSSPPESRVPGHPFIYSDGQMHELAGLPLPHRAKHAASTVLAR